LLGLAGLDSEGLRQQMEGEFSDARAPVGKDVSGVVRGLVAPEALDGPIYFMTDDDPSRGLNQENLIGLSYASVAQPNHIETVVVRHEGALWKYSRYFDNPQYWSSPGVPGERGVQDEVAQQLGLSNDPGVYPVVYRKQVKVVPEPEEFELYNLTRDPMELVNLAGRDVVAEIEAQLKALLARQSAVKRLTPISGVVPGQEAPGDDNVSEPPAVENTYLQSGSRLENMVIGQGTTFGEGVYLGPGVRFTQDAVIPAGLVLTHALAKVPWIGARLLQAVNLNDDVVISDGENKLPSILRAIQLLDEYEPAGNEVWQDAGTGEITISTPDSLSVVLPVEVFQAEASQAPGTYVTEDGDILFVTKDGRAVVAHPVVADLPALLAGAAKLQQKVEFDEQANIILYSPDDDHYFIGRPFAAITAPEGEREGLVSHPLADLPGVHEHSIVFPEGDHKRMQQPLVPRPADWPGLKKQLQEMSDVDEVRIDAHGIIVVKFNDGSLIEGRASYQVNISDRAPTGGSIEVQSAGDLNGNGMPDYLITYPNGDTQLIHVYTSRM
jgi:hypothetical protein